QGVFRTSDGKWLAISTPDDATWRALAHAIGRDDLAGDSGLATEAGRYERVGELDGVLRSWCATRPIEATFAELQGAGIPAAPLLDDELLIADPNVAARGWLQPLRSTDTGEHLHIGHAFRGVPQAWDRGSPALGEDNEYVFKKILGLDEAGYHRLAE